MTNRLEKSKIRISNALIQSISRKAERRLWECFGKFSALSIVSKMVVNQTASFSHKPLVDEKRSEKLH